MFLVRKLEVLSFRRNGTAFASHDLHFTKKIDEVNRKTKYRPGDLRFHYIWWFVITDAFVSLF